MDVDYKFCKMYKYHCYLEPRSCKSFCLTIIRPLINIVILVCAMKVSLLLLLLLLLELLNVLNYLQN